ncbi:MAG TPA: hypothetical protein VF598_08935 [Hymenobacter sp.]
MVSRVIIQYSLLGSLIKLSSVTFEQAKTVHKTVVLPIEVSHDLDDGSMVKVKLLILLDLRERGEVVGLGIQGHHPSGVDRRSPW